MSHGDPIQTAFDDFARELGFKKKSGTWYRRQPETIALLQLQKSQWGAQYYVNVALWLLPLGESDHPKEHQAHVRTRLTKLVTEEEATELERLLDLEAEVPDREQRLLELLRTRLGALLDETGTIADLRDGSGRWLVGAALVMGPAQRLLQTT